MPLEDEHRDEPLEVYWDEINMSRSRPTPEERPSSESWGLQPGDMAIGTSRERILVVIRTDGSLVYGPEYTPDEAAVVFWEEMGRRRLEMEERLLLIHHMEAILTRLGSADLHNQVASERLRASVNNENLRVAQRAQATLERAMHNAIELGRGIARRPDIPVPTTPQRIPQAILDNPNSSYGENPSDEVPSV